MLSDGVGGVGEDLAGVGQSWGGNLHPLINDCYLKKYKCFPGGPK